MTVYESNFIRLGWLLPKPPRPGVRLESHTPADCPLYLEATEVSRYTTTLTLTYLFEEGQRWIADPNLVVRMYHDAKLVEAMACTDKHRHRVLAPFATGAGSELQQRWTRNMMLNKWLEYCADRGHFFGDG